jgi:hypothetical protein
VALQAKEVHLGEVQKPRIGRTVRRVADRAALDLHRFVFIHEGSGFVGVTLEANQILRGRGSQLPGQESAMRVVAVGAPHEAFVDPVMEGPGKLLLLVEMAAVAKRGLACLEEELALFRMMGVVTVGAGHPVLEVYGTRVIAVFFPVLVAPCVFRSIVISDSDRS